MNSTVIWPDVESMAFSELELKQVDKLVGVMLMLRHNLLSSQFTTKGGAEMKLHVTAFAIAVGVVWGIGVFLITWWIILFEGQTGATTFLGLVYRGYNISALGSVIGLGWAAVDGLIGGAIFAWVYNFVVARCSAKRE